MRRTTLGNRTNLKKKRKLGFLVRMSTKNGAKVISRRRAKCRRVLSS